MKLTRKQALEQGYELCIYEWGGGEDGVEMIKYMEEENFENETVYLLGKDPIDPEADEPMYPRLNIELIP